MGRPSLLDEPTPAPADGMMHDVFDDEFAVDEDFDMVADGFRPDAEEDDGAEETREENAESEHAEPPITSISARYAPGPVSPGPSSREQRSSISKPRDLIDNPFSSPDDGEEPSMSFEPGTHTVHRSLSSASSHHFARTDSPSLSSGPSHPYGMYQQDTMTRSLSNATASTSRPLHRPLDPPPSGPQHPYNLYPQTVDEDLDDELDAPHNPVPIGFAGVGQSYHRQMGPDGEEQDIIGADGHAEQLPPYTRYPEDGPEKMPLLVPAPPVALHSRAPVAGTDPSMPLMHTSLQPTPSREAQPERERQSMTDPSALARNPSISSTERRAGLYSSSSSFSSMDSTKKWKEKNWKEKRKTKFCGVPFWCVLLAMGVVGFIAIVIGGVIGGFVEGSKKAVPPKQSNMYDAISVPTPTTGPPTGTFQLSLSTPQETQNACLPQDSQKPAWSCQLGGPPASAITVNETGATISFAGSLNDDSPITYGVQTPWMNTTFSQFLTVQDRDDTDLGPAYYFQTRYNKLVVIPEWELQQAHGDQYNKRDFILDNSWLEQKLVAQPGDRPWFCVWNNTFIEGFIYVDQNVATTITTSSLMTATPSPSSKYAHTGTSGAGLITTSPTPTSDPDASMSSAITEASATATYQGPSSDFASWSSQFVDHQKAYSSSKGYDDDDDYGDGDGDDDDDDDKSGYLANTPAQKRAAASASASATSLYDTLDFFPYMVKLEERRLSGNTVTPYCQQYQILDDGEANQVMEHGQPVVFYLDESDPSPTAYSNSGTGKFRNPSKRLINGACHCQWMSGQ